MRFVRVDTGPDILAYLKLSEHERKTKGKFYTHKLCLQYAPLVKSVSGFYAKRKPQPQGGPEVDDLVQAGYEGILLALSKFRPPKNQEETGKVFTACVEFYIRRSVQSVLERAQPVYRSRQGAMPAKLIRKSEAIKTSTGRDATAEELGIPASQLKRWKSVPQCVNIESGLRVYSRHVTHPIRVSLLATISDRLSNPVETLEHADMLRALSAAMERLPDDALECLLLRHREGKAVSFSRIAAIQRRRVEAVEDMYERTLDRLYSELK